MESPPTAGRSSGLVIGVVGAIVGVAGLSLGGWTYFQKNPGAKAEKESDERTPGKNQQEGKSTEGRFVLEQLPDAGQVIGDVGRLGFLGQPLLQAWVYRFRGGFLETWLEHDFSGSNPIRFGPIPENFPRLLTQETKEERARTGSTNKEGYIVLAAMTPVLPPDESLKPFLPQLGGFLAPGPAAPLYLATLLHAETWQPREYRLFLATRPPRKGSGSAFRLWTGGKMLLRLPFIAGPLPEDDASFKRKEVRPGQNVTLLEFRRGYSKFTLQARFISDASVEKIREAANRLIKQGETSAP